MKLGCIIVRFLHVVCNHVPYPQVWINQGDIVLIGLRDYQDAKADVILRYNPDEARNLKTYGELPETGISLHFSIYLHAPSLRAFGACYDANSLLI